MTIDEVIKQIEKIVEDNQRIVDTHRFSDVLTIEEAYCDDTEIIEERLAVYQKRADDFRQLAEWLKELKQLREQTRWIPCSEKLPEDRENILFSTKAGIVFEGRFFDDKTNFQWYEYRYKQFEPNNDVTAWQPLPEPYQEEKE